MQELGGTPSHRSYRSHKSHPFAEPRANKSPSARCAGTLTPSSS
jgi:hypothetical protein